MGMVYSEPACQAAYDRDVRQLYQLLKDDGKNLNVQDAVYGDTPVISACRRGSAKVVQYLLDNKADVMITNKKKRTSLHYVAKRTFSFLDYLMIAILMPVLLIGYLIMVEKQKQNVSLMKLVLSSGVDVNATDYKGNTALHYVCERKSHRVIPLLLEKNADVYLKNNREETPLDVANRLKFKEIAAMLKKTH
ncbi:ankyrin repeat domain-containing protein 22 [Aplochiton taeniatus]